MVAVAVAAVAITALLMRPYPIRGMAVLGVGVVWWSDGTSTKGAIPVPTNLVGFGPLLKAEWSDGSTSWYLGRSARTDDSFRREEAGRQAAALVGDGSEVRRSAAATWIALHAELIPPEGVVPALVVAAHDPSPDVRRSAVSALPSFLERSPEAVTAASGALRDGDPVVRVIAASVLGSIRLEAGPARAAAVPALAAALEDENASVRSQAAKSLATLRAAHETDPAVIEALQGHGR
jgi:HEAT repeat protein